MLCQRCGLLEAAVFLTQQQGDGFYTEDLCPGCARALSPDQERAVRDALDRAAPPRA